MVVVGSVVVVVVVGVVVVVVVEVGACVVGSGVVGGASVEVTGPCIPQMMSMESSAGEVRK